VRLRSPPKAEAQLFTFSGRVLLLPLQRRQADLTHYKPGIPRFSGLDSKTKRNQNSASPPQTSVAIESIPSLSG
jgi:hypothetical protein